MDVHLGKVNYLSIVIHKYSSLVAMYVHLHDIREWSMYSTLHLLSMRPTVKCGMDCEMDCIKDCAMDCRMKVKVCIYKIFTKVSCWQKKTLFQLLGPDELKLSMFLLLAYWMLKHVH